MAAGWGAEDSRHGFAAHEVRHEPRHARRQRRLGGGANDERGKLTRERNLIAPIVGQSWLEMAQERIVGQTDQGYLGWDAQATPDREMTQCTRGLAGAGEDESHAACRLKLRAIERGRQLSGLDRYLDGPSPGADRIPKAAPHQGLSAIFREHRGP